MDISCKNCAVKACQGNEKEKYPQFCPTKNMDNTLLNSALEKYKEEENQKTAYHSARIEGEFYGKMTRVEEIIAFAKRMDFEKIGIANCVGLLSEANVFAKAVEKHGLQCIMLSCKAGAVDKSCVGVEDQYKLNGGCGHESMCNPILQAEYMNSRKTHLNVIVGLCVGHDSLFIKYSNALVTTLVTKDRVLAHNPAAALYTSSTYYKRIFD